MLYTYKYRLSPNKHQQVLLNKHFGATKFLYNYYLEQRKNIYQETGKSLNYYDQAKDLTGLKKELF